MSDLRERLQKSGKTAQELFEAGERFYRKNFTIKTNRSGNGISITSQGLLTIQKNLANKIGEEDLEYLEVRQQFSDSDSLLILKVCSRSNAEKLQDFEELEEKGTIKKRQNTKKQVKFSVKTILRAYIDTHGSEELNDRWIEMFNNAKSKVLDTYSYVFTEKDGSLIHEQTDDGENMFVIDMMSGEG